MVSKTFWDNVTRIQRIAILLAVVVLLVTTATVAAGYQSVGNGLAIAAYVALTVGVLLAIAVYVAEGEGSVEGADSGHPLGPSREGFWGRVRQWFTGRP